MHALHSYMLPILVVYSKHLIYLASSSNYSYCSYLLAIAIATRMVSHCSYRFSLSTHMEFLQPCFIQG